MLLLLGVGISIAGSTGVFYSTMTAIVRTEEIGAATAGGQTAISVGGLGGPPAVGFLADTVGYEAGWALLAGVGPFDDAAVRGAALARSQHSSVLAGVRACKGVEISSGNGVVRPSDALALVGPRDRPLRDL
jgi:MFS family permease